MTYFALVNKSGKSTLISDIYQMPFHQRYGSTRKELITIINDYIQWYNEERIQEGLGYLSPTNFFKKMNLETVAN